MEATKENPEKIKKKTTDRKSRYTDAKIIEKTIAEESESQVNTEEYLEIQEPSMTEVSSTINNVFVMDNTNWMLWSTTTIKPPPDLNKIVYPDLDSIDPDFQSESQLCNDTAIVESPNNKLDKEPNLISFVSLSGNASDNQVVNSTLYPKLPPSSLQMNAKVDFKPSSKSQGVITSSLLSQEDLMKSWLSNLRSKKPEHKAKPSAPPLALIQADFISAPEDQEYSQYPIDASTLTLKTSFEENSPKSLYKITGSVGKYNLLSCNDNEVKKCNGASFIDFDDRFPLILQSVENSNISLNTALDSILADSEATVSTVGDESVDSSEEYIRLEHPEAYQKKDHELDENQRRLAYLAEYRDHKPLFNTVVNGFRYRRGIRHNRRLEQVKKSIPKQGSHYHVPDYILPKYLHNYYFKNISTTAPLTSSRSTIADEQIESTTSPPSNSRPRWTLFKKWCSRVANMVSFAQISKLFTISNRPKIKVEKKKTNKEILSNSITFMNLMQRSRNRNIIKLMEKKEADNSRKKVEHSRKLVDAVETASRNQRNNEGVRSPKIRDVNYFDALESHIKQQLQGVQERAPNINKYDGLGETESLSKKLRFKEMTTTEFDSENNISKYSKTKNSPFMTQGLSRDDGFESNFDRKKDKDQRKLRTFKLLRKGYPWKSRP